MPSITPSCGGVPASPRLARQTLEGVYLHAVLAVNSVVSGRYRIVKPLGGGGMKQVYLAEDLRLANRQCALAEMLDTFADPAMQRKAATAFHREAEMLATLDNPHIPRVYDNFSEQNRHYLVMEYVQGSTLEERLARSGARLTEDEVTDIGLQTAEALEYLHGLRPPIVYRDLKPSNVMVTAGGLVKLIDFGIARYFQPLKTATAIGTQGYAAPEQYKGKAEVRSDIYALGATMHHLLTGRDPAMEPPFSFPPIEQLRAHCNPALASLINGALAYKPEDRPTSASEIRELLLSVKAGTSLPAKDSPGATSPSAITRRVTLGARPRVPRWFLAAVFALLTAGAAASLLLQLTPERGSAARAPTSAAKPSTSLAEATPASAPIGSSVSAEELEKEALAKPNDVDAWLRAADAWLRRAEADETYYPRALAAYEHVLTLAPKDLEALRAVGNIELREKEYGKAVSTYRRYFAKSGDDPAVRLNLAVAYIRVGRASKAIPECKRVLAQDPSSFRAQLILGAAYTSTGNYSEARAALRKAAKLAPDEKAATVVAKLSADLDQRTAAWEAQKARQRTVAPKSSEKSEGQATESHPRYFTIGSTKDDVLALEGTPLAVHDYIYFEVWEYAAFGCSVQFKDGRVDSYDNSCGRLHVRIK
jgi:serine/threonine protein kinase